jgi:hypothetical protein
LAEGRGVVDFADGAPVLMGIASVEAAALLACWTAGVVEMPAAPGAADESQ